MYCQIYYNRQNRQYFSYLKIFIFISYTVDEFFKNHSHFYFLLTVHKKILESQKFSTFGIRGIRPTIILALVQYIKELVKGGSKIDKSIHIKSFL